MGKDAENNRTLCSYVILITNKFEKICLFIVDQSSKKEVILFGQREWSKTKSCCFTVSYVVLYFISLATSLLPHMASACPCQDLGLLNDCAPFLGNPLVWQKHPPPQSPKLNSMLGPHFKRENTQGSWSYGILCDSKRESRWAFIVFLEGMPGSPKYCQMCWKFDNSAICFSYAKLLSQPLPHSSQRACMVNITLPLFPENNLI